MLPPSTTTVEGFKAPSSRRLFLEPRILTALAIIYLLWGTSYLAIKQAGTEFPPLLLVGLRNLAAGVVLLSLVSIQGRNWGAPRLWVNAAMVGVLMISVGAAFLAMGLQHVSSGFAAVTFAAVPIVVCVLMVTKGRRITAAQWVGTIIGLAGLQLTNQGVDSELQQRGMWLVLAAVVATAASAVLMDHLPMPEDIIVTTGVQMVAGGGVASLVGWFMGERLSNVSTQALAAWLYLSLLVSVLGYLSYNYLMVKAGPVMASSYAYVNPPIALLAGAWLLGEPVSGLTLVATGVVLTGAATVLVATPRRVPSTLLVPLQEKAKTL